MRRWLQWGLLATVLWAGVAGCGGSSDSGPAPPVPPTRFPQNKGAPKK
jgi:hypothetical protein